MTVFVLLGSIFVQAKLITERATGFKKYILLPPEMGLFDFWPYFWYFFSYSP